MSTLSLEDFEAFFRAVHDGQSPFPWQRRLVRELVETGRWPEQLSAPTGAGKTAVIDAHVFAVAAMADGWGARVPRRLALVVPRRVLVDSQYDYACRLAHCLSETPSTESSEPVLAHIAQALSTLRWPRVFKEGASPLLVARMRGGTPPARSWRDDPLACSIISATPDMWGSRVLFHGYGSSPRSWPREAGLLAFDAVMVLDEAHLARQLLESSRSVTRLLQAPPQAPEVPPLQVVETSATPITRLATTGRALGVEEDDLDSQLLRKRLTTPKPLRLLLSKSGFPGKGKDTTMLTDEIVAEVCRLHERYGATIGVFVNTVGLAVHVSDHLRKVSKPEGLNVALICGRMRDYDVDDLRRRYPGLLSLQGNPEVDVLVATQTLEVGVDLDLSAAVSELAPAGALAQRAGRVNRLGQRGPDETEFVVVVPQDPNNLKGEVEGARPYTSADLYDALEWLERRKQDEAGLAPWALRDDPPPTGSPRRPVFQRVELADSWWWARTSDEIDPPIDLELWLSDDLDEIDLDVGVLVRRELPTDFTEAITLVRALPIADDEVFPAPISTVRSLIQRTQQEGSSLPILVVRSDEVTDATTERLRPGDIVVIDERLPWFAQGVVRSDGTECAADVSECRSNPRAGEVVLRIDTALRENDAASALGAIEKILVAASNERVRRAQLAEIIETSELRSTMVAPAVKLLKRGKLKEVAVVQVYDSDERLAHLIIVDQRTAPSDEVVRQTWTLADEPPTLEQHANGVSARSAALARALGLSEMLCGVLEQAGKHHDDGKADERFQRERLGWEGKGPLRAKGAAISVRTKTSTTLPARWRHEQLSVVRALEHLAPDWHPPEVLALEPALTMRLVGTSHGYGRASFPHAAGELLTPGDRGGELAKLLFDEGHWDDLMERSMREVGAWGCAYLEAILRAADGQVSGEGS